MCAIAVFNVLENVFAITAGVLVPFPLSTAQWAFRTQLCAAWQTIVMIQPFSIAGNATIKLSDRASSAMRPQSASRGKIVAVANQVQGERFRNWRPVLADRLTVAAI